MIMNNSEFPAEVCSAAEGRDAIVCECWLAYTYIPSRSKQLAALVLQFSYSKVQATCVVLEDNHNSLLQLHSVVADVLQVALVCCVGCFLNYPRDV